ncbi:probable dolichyl pyrophosphate Glc1Man9GlcNAc2 alpha-1,3-glucosyltransferase [Mercurialis annua]|uniref:probable dolichyl pyrophosphate Glc1Man9GlcNAc2 alpha-1,3-glucosyltransferase n=1 Tax=Mercurialis annua TaxID=3986 RepID=UPI00215EFC4D|nr:probable dolichyl pyrophosphate Glc1Man9GlcNAc2 alpha-1,3-glucosyltransferase [Mercurialis annua]
MHAESATIVQILWFFGISACIKLILIPSYHSTDFEVHRHWLALTHSLPLTRWYVDETSPWTLDYPPFFAYYEYFLSLFAQFIDPQIVDIYRGLNYKSNTVLYFQRITVIVSDLCLLLGLYRLTKNLEPRKRILSWVLVVWSPGLIMVDHMHFQYNGFLLGLLLLSVSYLQEGRDVMGGFVFAVLLCFKHLFAVAAPVYFVYLMRHYCWKGFFVGFRRLSALGAVVVVVFAAAYGPFLYHGQIQQVIRRMFPFGRGLCHAYWAPNFWVFYMMLDKCLSIIFRKLGFNIQAPIASFTGGLVGDSSPFAVLPQVTPLTTFIMVLLALSPCLFKAWKNPQPRFVARWIAYAYTCGFFFGWHVHEKASLHFVIPLAIIASQSLEDARHYFLLSIASYYSLFPLLHEAQEYPIKVLLLLLHTILMWYSFSAQFMTKERDSATKGSEQYGSKGRSSGNVERARVFGWVGKCYLVGLLGIEIWGQFLHPYFVGDKLPFVPLLLTSTFCALEIMYSWIWQLRWIITST